MILRKSMWLLIVLLSSGSVWAQDFEGKIVYKNSFKSKLPNVTDEQFTLMLGSTQEYYLKGGNYKSVTNGTFLKWSIFVNKDGKIYNKMGNSEALLWNDVTANTDDVVKAEINKNVIKILGYACDELILTNKNSTEKYYFNSALKLNPDLFVNHKLGHWNEFTRRSNAVPLKMIISTPQFTVESLATEILPMKLEPSLFELPAGVKTEKSPF